MGASIHSLYFALKFVVQNTLETAATKSETQLLLIPPTAVVGFAKNVALTFNYAHKKRDSNTIEPMTVSVRSQIQREDVNPIADVQRLTD